MKVEGLIHPALAVEVDLNGLRLQGHVGQNVVEGMVLGSEAGDKHPLRVWFHP